MSEPSEATQRVIAGLGLFVLGIILGIAIRASFAHPPCDNQPPRCHYVQVVNPITGQLEQQYVCE